MLAMVQFKKDRMCYQPQSYKPWYNLKADDIINREHFNHGKIYKRITSTMVQFKRGPLYQPHHANDSPVCTRPGVREYIMYRDQTVSQKKIITLDKLASFM